MSEHKYQQTTQLESAIIDGVDISGEWNRMYVPREITDYDTQYLEEITALTGGESLGYCYQCAKCVGVCPVDNVGSYAPRKIFRKVQAGLNLIEDKDLWMCTTCMNCLRVCPKEVNMLEIMPSAREKAVLDGKTPDELQEMLRSVAEYGNPMGESARNRIKWMKKLNEKVRDLSKEDGSKPVDVLWHVSDYYAYHGRGNDAAKAMVRVFNKLGTDFGILGKEEKTDGDSQRLVGESGLFDELVRHNDALFQKYPHNRLVVTDPHALNAFKKHYPAITGNELKAEHYTQFLSEKLEEIKPLLKREFAKKVTFHDPCYLGRHNGEYDAPRNLINAIPGAEFVEMYRNKQGSYCCGGGGGGQWLGGTVDEHLSERLSDNRVREAVEVGAEVLIVCCPYEVSRFEDSVKATGNDGKLIVRDIIEILDYCMGED
ncbi:protein of unknown function DUF224 cysteine-rich region domain protein [Chloroherpeton thalassium ATCC 35110]|uniref:4Fe-4S ferredoxin-type domain-containing protein n=1 Tax=Chloroherpeton thalassium (strain ATCC 35110 / GB-78) TaxID=517418 RepID=B3QSW1_CHLT3|nr:(Fe-S)-binding protein [Chloroherpeton thalassium]ACF12604.1 protein of unknown function DUF224 cysteine-rich region domain protein [Chloroherpeton thalassium ATCC 35110]